MIKTYLRLFYIDEENSFQNQFLRKAKSVIAITVPIIISFQSFAVY
jgi:hypothetical protein